MIVLHFHDVSPRAGGRDGNRQSGRGTRAREPAGVRSISPAGRRRRDRRAIIRPTTQGGKGL